MYAQAAKPESHILSDYGSAHGQRAGPPGRNTSRGAVYRSQRSASCRTSLLDLGPYHVGRGKRATNLIACITRFFVKMGWHGGYALSQTLYTSLYMHQIAPTWQDGMVPQYFPARRYDPLRPLGLVSIVLQAGLMAIVKTCDMVWRELNKGHVFDVSGTTMRNESSGSSWVCRVRWKTLMRTRPTFLYSKAYKFPPSLANSTRL